MYIAFQKLSVFYAKTVILLSCLVEAVGETFKCAFISDNKKFICYGSYQSRTFETVILMSKHVLLKND